MTFSLTRTKDHCCSERNLPAFTWQEIVLRWKANLDNDDQWHQVSHIFWRNVWLAHQYTRTWTQPLSVFSSSQYSTWQPQKIVMNNLGGRMWCYYQLGTSTMLLISRNRVCCSIRSPFSSTFMNWSIRKHPINNDWGIDHNTGGKPRAIKVLLSFKQWAWTSSNADGHDYHRHKLQQFCHRPIDSHIAECNVCLYCSPDLSS